MGKIIEFKVKLNNDNSEMISPETMKEMPNQKLIESTKFVANFVADAKDEDEQDDFMDLLYDAIDELDNRLKFYVKLTGDYQRLVQIMENNAVNLNK